MRWGSLWMLISVAASAGAPRTVTIAAGDCQNPELLTATQTLSAAVAGRSPEVLSAEAVLERFRPVPTLSTEDLDRQLEAAQAQFYAGTYDKALETLRTAIAAIERLSPRATPWKAMSRALMLQGLVLKSMGKKHEANEAQKRVLRIEPGFKLDPDYYTPATLQAFELLRKEMEKTKKVRLTLASSPSGAEVFLDGALVGKTPFGRELPLGEYRLSLASGAQLSFLRELELSRDEAVQVDLAFEGALSPQAPLCVNVPAAQTLDTALKLAALAGADTLVVPRLEARNNEPGWVTAVLLEVGKGAKIRDGGIRFTGPRRNDALDELAAFVLTGKATGAVVATLGAAAAAPKVEAPRVEPGSEAPVAVLTPSEPQAGGSRGPRIASFALMGAGAIAAGAGLAVYLSGGGDRGALGQLLDEQGRVRPGASASEAISLQGKVDGNATTSLIVGAGGAAVLAAGVAVFFLFPPEDAPVVSVAPTREGVWAGASFSF